MVLLDLGSDEVKPGETRAECLARWEREERLDPHCRGCQEFYKAVFRADGAPAVLLGYSQVMAAYDDPRMEDLLDTLAEKRDACGEYDGREDDDDEEDDEDWPEDVYRE